MKFFIQKMQDVKLKLLGLYSAMREKVTRLYSVPRGRRTSSSKKHQRENQAKKRGLIYRYLKAPAWFLVGVVVTLFFQNWVVRLLPGPKMVLTVNGTRYADHCVLYEVKYHSSQTIDYTHMRLGLPGMIEDTATGISEEVVAPNGKGTRITAYGVGRIPNDACHIVPFVIAKSESISSSSTGNELFIQIGKLPGKTFVEVLGVVDERKSKLWFENPHLEGEYEYTELGLPVRKKLHFTDLGLLDQKSAP